MTTSIPSRISVGENPLLKVRTLLAYILVMIAFNSCECRTTKNVSPLRPQRINKTPSLARRPLTSNAEIETSLAQANLDSLWSIRGGSSIAKDMDSSSSNSTSSKKKRRKKRKKRKTADKSDLSEGKDVINKSLGKDSAEALGDAIRDRAETLRSESPLLDSIDQSIYSVGWALGASDRRRFDGLSSEAAPLEEEDDGGVAGSPTSVLVSYFLKSHGGAHALQCLCSVLASTAGVAALLFPTKNPMKLVLLKRTMLFAMTKHVSGLFAAAFLAARAIPEVGLRKARVWMEQLALDPVSQYVFYTACVLLWLPSASAGMQKMLISGDKFQWIPIVLVAPILLREVVSTILVVSDVLVLWVSSSSSTGNSELDDNGAGEKNVEAAQKLLQVSQACANALMSLLVTPQKWRGAGPAMRQQILAKLTSQLSLAMEVFVGVIFALDALGRITKFIFGTVSDRPAFLEVLKRMICARLYIQFLLSRKRKIGKLVTNIRGGSSQLPFYVMDILMDPRASMGIEKTKKGTKSATQALTWKDIVLTALGLDD